MHGHGRVGGAAGAQVVAVGIHERGPVPGRADHPLGLGGAGVPLDRVQRQAQPTGAFQQPGSRIEQVVDLPPPLGCRLGVPAVFGRRPGCRPAGAVRGDFLQHRLGQAVPQMPAITDDCTAPGSARRTASP